MAEVFCRDLPRPKKVLLTHDTNFPEKNSLIPWLALTVPILVTKVAECHEVGPVHESRWILTDWHNVVNLTARRDPAILLAVLTQWVQSAVSPAQGVPPPIMDSPHLLGLA